MTSDSRPVRPDSPDLILHGGIIHTLDANAAVVEALAVSGGRVVATGTTRDIRALAGPETRTIDLAGRTVLPGINDAHIHATWLGASWPRLMFDDPETDWHGRFLPSRAARRAAILRAFRLMASLGITSFTEPGLGPGEDDGPTGCFGSDVLDLYAELAGEGAATARVTVLRLFGLLDGASDLAAYEGGLNTVLPKTDPEWVNVTGIKIFGDGIPPMKTAWVLDDYDDGTHGALLTGTGDDEARQAVFERMIRLAHDRGHQIGVHATGDRTIEVFVSTIEALGGAGGRGHYVIHGDLLRPEQLARLASAGIGLALQPLIAERSRGWMSDSVTPEVARRSFPLADIFASSVRAVLSSDAPIASPDWRRIVASAARQWAATGRVIGRDEITQLLRMYTTLPAAQDGAAAWKGALEPCKVADLCVLSDDPYRVGAEALESLSVELTIVGGRVVFDAAQETVPA